MVTCPNCAASGLVIVDIYVEDIYDRALFHGCLYCDHTFHRKWLHEGIATMIAAKVAPYMRRGTRAILKEQGARPLPAWATHR